WDFIKEPGTYRVSWKGKHFQSPEAVLRIVPREPAPSKESGMKLWAAVSVLPPVFQLDGPSANPSMLFLDLVNDGKETTETGVETSVIVLKDQSQQKWEFKADRDNGPRSDEWTRLPPGVATGMGRGCPAHVIGTPGIYRVACR